MNTDQIIFLATSIVFSAKTQEKSIANDTEKEAVKKSFSDWHKVLYDLYATHCSSVMK